MSIRVSVVVPVFNSPGTLGELVESVGSVLRGQVGDEFEIILVDDASSDPEVWPNIERLAREGKNVRAARLTRNFGQQAATLCGLEMSRGDKILTMDDDLQHSPEDIPLLLEKSEHDVVIGHLQQKRHSLPRRAASHVKGWFDRIIVGKPRGIQLSSFRLIDRTIIDAMLRIRTSRPFLPSLIFHVTKDVVGVPLMHRASALSGSRYSYMKLFRLFVDLVIYNSSLMLRIAGNAGLLFSFISVVGAGYVIYMKAAHGIAVQGWASLFVAILFIGGLLLLCMGILGEYLIRIIEGNEARPCYVIRKEV